MSRPNRGPKLTRRIRLDRLFNPYLISWTEDGRTRELSADTEDFGLAKERLSDFLRMKGMIADDGGSRSLEQDISEALFVPEGSAWQYPTPVGKIDVLTPEEVIEVKSSANWKAAIGQVLAYQAFFPDRRARIHLFGRKLPERHLQVCVRLCRRLHIKITFDPRARPTRGWKSRALAPAE